jgi:uncharacterized protein (DUF302 family)
LASALANLMLKWGRSSLPPFGFFVMRYLLPLVIFGSLSFSVPLPAAAERVAPPPGMVQRESNFSVETTVNRLADLLQERGLTVFNRIDHAENAAGVDQELRPTELIIFGNPTAGTALMQCNQTVGIDLPLKALIWEDASGQVWFAYSDPVYLMERHGLQNCEDVIRNVNAALDGLATAATEEM